LRSELNILDSRNLAWLVAHKLFDAYIERKMFYFLHFVCVLQNLVLPIVFGDYRFDWLIDCV
jgi:hypothetical protein